MAFPFLRLPPDSNMEVASRGKSLTLLEQKWKLKTVNTLWQKEKFSDDEGENKKSPSSQMNTGLPNPKVFNHYTQCQTQVRRYLSEGPVGTGEPKDMNSYLAQEERTDSYVLFKEYIDFQISIYFLKQFISY